MSFRFRFPQAILHYVKNGSQGIDVAIEMARDWAQPEAGEKRKRPNLAETAEWVSKVVEEDQRARQEAKENG